MYALDLPVHLGPPGGLPAELHTPEEVARPRRDGDRWYVEVAGCAARDALVRRWRFRPCAPEVSEPVHDPTVVAHDPPAPPEPRRKGRR